jgi:hypothetical protein
MDRKLRLLSPEQLDRYRPWFENAQRIRQMLTELEDLSLQAANDAEGWTDEPPNSGESRPANARTTYQGHFATA